MKITLLFLFFFSIACSDSGPNTTLPNIDIPDTNPGTIDPPDMDTDKVKPLSRSVLQENVNPNGVNDVSKILGEGEARVGQTKDNAGFHGVSAHCKAGDYKLYNKNVEFCVQGLNTNRYEFFHGGALVDLRPVGSNHEDVFDIWIPRYDFTTFDAQKISVIRDGTKGGPAVLRVEGVDVQIAHLVGAIGTSLFRPRGYNITVEYRLFPDTHYLEIDVWTKKTNGKPGKINAGEFVGFGERTRLWTPDIGFELQNATFANSFVAQYQKQSFGWYRHKKSKLFTSTLDALPWLMAQTENAVPIKGSEEIATQRFIIVGDGTTASVTATIEKLKKSNILNQKIIIKYENGMTAKGRNIEIFEGEHAIAFGKTDANGSFTFSNIPATKVIISGLFGESDHIFAIQDSNTFTLPTPAKIDVQVNDEKGRISASITLIHSQKNTKNRKTYVVSSQAQNIQEVGTGNFTIVADHGMEWDIQQQDITLKGGDTKKIILQLERVLDTKNLIAGDFHQHMEPSIDSEVSVRDRVLDNVGQGVEFATPTDHEVVTDLQPYITELGLDKELRTVSGIEVSPSYAHMNWFPMEYQPDARARGSVPLSFQKEGKAQRRSFPEMIALARLLPSAPVIQINHGRGGSGFFNTYDFNPETGEAKDDFPTDFDAMEILNDEEETCLTLEDWAALLNMGLRPTAMGNSDTHGLWRGVGNNRNYLSSPTDIPSEIKPQDIKQAILQNQNIVARYALLDFPDALPGDLISTDKNTPVNLRIRVQTPPYSRVDTILVFANGEIIDTILVNSNDEDIVDLDMTYPLSFKEDTWVTFIAWGPNITNIINGGEAVFSMPNAIFVDVDGDVNTDGNLFEAPGTGRIDLDALEIALDVKGVCTEKREKKK